MTYCVALKLDEGLVCLSDTRTNAGVDDISRYKKTFTWEGRDRAVIILSAGNLSVTQGVIDRLEQAQIAARTDDTVETILNVSSLFRLAQIIGLSMRDMIDRHGDSMQKDGASSGASMLVGGQIEGEAPRLFLVYSAGNFIECGEDTPYFQIGEAKYGKPIIDRTITSQTSLADGVKTALVSMDSTIRSNLSVGLPLDLSVIRAGTQRFAARRRVEENDETYAAISAGWSEALGHALAGLPAVGDWLDG